MIELINRYGKLPRNVTAKGVKRVIRRALRGSKERNKYLCALLVSDAGIKRLNRKYFGKNRPTDVIAFPMDDRELLGDIALSIDAAKRQCGDFGNSADEEVLTLAVHGVLHLLGYDDIREEDARTMRERTNRILAECAGGGGKWKKRK